MFAEQTAQFKRALETVDFGDAVIITGDPALLNRPAVAWAEVLANPVTGAVARAVESLDPDAHSRYMLTSGSTSMPKAVIQTQRMVTANAARRGRFSRTANWSDAMLDWLPRSHVPARATSSRRCAAAGISTSMAAGPSRGCSRNRSRTCATCRRSFYINVPFGYAMLVDHLERDADFRQRFFSQLRLCLYGGAGLSQALYDRFQRLAVDTVGERIFFTTGYGATETASGCMSIYFPTEEVGIGLPMPGIELKLVPQDARYEIRIRGQLTTPGYLDKPELNREIFDDEGFYRTGDTAQFHDPQDVQKGLKFAGRLAEDFKLATGTWITAGRLRAELLEATAPLLADVVVCGENRDYVALLAWARIAGADIRDELARRLAVFNAGRGQSERVARLKLLVEPPSADQHEVSDKGTINQRVTMMRRAEPTSSGSMRIHQPTTSSCPRRRRADSHSQFSDCRSSKWTSRVAWDSSPVAIAVSARRSCAS